MGILKTGIGIKNRLHCLIVYSRVRNEPGASSLAFDLRHKIIPSGFFSLAEKNFTTIPVNRAEIIVPSLVPTIVKSKNIRDKTMERVTQKISNAILTFPNSLFIVSEIAFTKASPEFIITFAITAREIPKPRIIIPTITIIMRM